jgi:octaprenyl-diphosphate synthase
MNGATSVPPPQYNDGKIRPREPGATLFKQGSSTSESPGHVFTSIFSLLASHLSTLDRFLHEQLEAFEPEIRSMADYCMDTSGKRIRPALVFLSGWRSGPEVHADLVRVAAVVEMVHLATLVHDDIMDGADLRRNRRTAARQYGATAAVLIGDALFAHALHLATHFPSTEVCAAVSESTRRVCAGEIVQTLRRGSTNVTRADYYRIVELKTAELFRVSCFLGARLVGAPDGYADAASTFGRHLGVAYQIYDDLVDFFGEESLMGKTLGTDFANGKLTLPLLTLLEDLPAPEAQNLIAELIGKQSPQPTLRLRQMRELRVLDRVGAAVNQELEQACLALLPWQDLAAVPLLVNLAEMLRNQVVSLNSTGLGSAKQ